MYDAWAEKRCVKNLWYFWYSRNTPLEKQHYYFLMEQFFKCWSGNLKRNNCNYSMLVSEGRFLKFALLSICSFNQTELLWLENFPSRSSTKKRQSLTILLTIFIPVAAILTFIFRKIIRWHGWNKLLIGWFFLPGRWFLWRTFLIWMCFFNEKNQWANKTYFQRMCSGSFKF